MCVGVCVWERESVYFIYKYVLYIYIYIYIYMCVCVCVCVVGSVYTYRADGTSNETILIWGGECLPGFFGNDEGLRFTLMIWHEVLEGLLVGKAASLVLTQEINTSFQVLVSVRYNNSLSGLSNAGENTVMWASNLLGQLTPFA